LSVENSWSNIASFSHTFVVLEKAIHIRTGYHFWCVIVNLSEHLS